MDRELCMTATCPKCLLGKLLLIIHLSWWIILFHLLRASEDTKSYLHKLKMIRKQLPSQDISTCESSHYICRPFNSLQKLLNQHNCISIRLWEPSVQAFGFKTIPHRMNPNE